MAIRNELVHTDMCRLCLQIGDSLLPIYTDNKLNIISDTIMSFTMIKISLNDGLPGQICNICSTRLHDCFEFKQQCEKSDLYLHSNKNDFDSGSNIHSKLKNKRPHDFCNQSKIKSKNTEGVEFIDLKHEYQSDGDLQVENDFDVDDYYLESQESEQHVTENGCNVDSNFSTDIVEITPAPDKTKEVEKQIFKCKICNADFARQKKLSLHMSEEHVGKFTCNMCSRKFVSPSGYQRHLQVHERDIADSLCNICGKKFSSNRNLRKHKLIHSGKLNIPCSVCGKFFAHGGNLKRHMMIHEGRRPFVCHICGYRFNQAVALNLHVSALHSAEKPHLCNVCGKRFTDSRLLEKHISSKHNDRQYPTEKLTLTCDICGKTLSTKQSLKYHLTTHIENPLRPFLCKECGKSFKTKLRLDAHERTHTGVKPFSCIQCPKKFTQHTGLKKHMLIHSGEKPHSCKICDKRFTQINHVYDHMLTHSGEKNHVCEVCNHRFALKGNLKAHVMTHTGETPFVCIVCNKGFYVKHKLKRHMEKAHSD